MGDRQLQGMIFKLDGTSYLVLPDNQWDSDQLTVRSIDARKQTRQLPRQIIQAQLDSVDVGVTRQ